MLRTAHDNSMESYCVLDGGSLYTDKDDSVFCIGVVPALNLLKSAIDTSSILSAEIAADDVAVEVTPKTITTAQTVSAAIANGEFTLSSEGKDGKVTLSYKPSRTDNATVIVVGDFGSGIEARKVELKTGYTVTWNIDGNTVTKTYAPGDKLTPPTVPIKDGYDFKGWDKTVPSIMPDKDLTFTAVYQKVSERKTVKAVSVDDISLYYKNSTTLKPTINADDGVKYTVTYTSSDTSVVRVDENGKVYGAKKGSAEITVTVTDEYGNTVSDTCKVNVTYAWWQWIIVIVLFGWIWY